MIVTLIRQDQIYRRHFLCCFYVWFFLKEREYEYEIEKEKYYAVLTLSMSMSSVLAIVPVYAEVANKI